MVERRGTRERAQQAAASQPLKCQELLIYLAPGVARAGSALRAGVYSAGAISARENVNAWLTRVRREREREDRGPFDDDDA